MRGEEPLEVALSNAFEALERADFQVACDELGEAWGALSRRPTPNISGAVMNAMAALEAVARQWSGSPKGNAR